MTHRLDLTLNHAEGALVRILGLAERRGYQPLSVQADTTPDGRILMALTVHARRPIDLLQRQLEKLLDVQSVRLAPALAEVAK